MTINFTKLQVIHKPETVLRVLAINRQPQGDENAKEYTKNKRPNVT
jgi:hypothetical protein